MEKRYNNYLAMCDSLRNVLAEYENSWSVLPAFQGLRNEFVSKVTQVETLGQQQDLIARNKTLEMQIRKKELITWTLRMQKSLKVYALDANDPLLYAEINFTTSELRRNMQQFLEYVDLIIAKAEMHMANLAPFGSSQADLDALIALRTAFNALRSEGRDKDIERKFITAEIRKLVGQIHTLLRKKMDELVDVLMDIDPEFHAKYFSARLVIDRPATHKSKSTGPVKRPGENPDAA